MSQLIRSVALTARRQRLHLIGTSSGNADAARGSVAAARSCRSGFFTRSHR
jgi:hypothetical protein